MMMPLAWEHWLTCRDNRVLYAHFVSECGLAERGFALAQVHDLEGGVHHRDRAMWARIIVRGGQTLISMMQSCSVHDE